MRYVGRQASPTDPLRSLILVRPACQVLPWTDRENAAFELSKARRDLPRAEAYLPMACGFLSAANRFKGWRGKQDRASALRLINKARAELRRARKALEVAEAAMQALDGDLFTRDR